MLLLAVLTPALWAQELLSPDEGLLLLAGGQVLRGKVTRAGDYYYVSLSEGEIRVKSSSVELFCHDLDEGYRRKRARIAQGTALDHLELAQWCLQQDLLGYAAQEVSAAMDLDPQQPRIPLLERRLELARSQQQQPAAHAEGADAALSNDDLDRMVRGMPAGTVDAFTHTIQPLILNHCTAAGCHGQGSGTAYSLLRIPLGRPPNRRLTQRNLFATLRRINASDPALSPLLQQAIREHGSAKTPVFTSHDAQQYRQLVIWVYRVSKSAPPPQLEAISRPSEPLLQTLPGSSSSAKDSRKASAPSGKTANDQTSAGPSAAKHSPPGLPQTPAVGGLPNSAADPLDPAVFNERFGAAPN
ncbi:MAG TPA: hypothetical protein VHY20_04245 [Pirellulales bacterium]|nr:hypothetical protein [Pirellulales bacterium]